MTPPGDDAAVPAAPTDRFAIASVACSLLAPVTVGATAVVGIVLGALALRRIGRSGDRGRRLALAGIAIGVAMLLVGVAATVLIDRHVSHSCSTHAYRGADYQHFCVDKRGPLMSR